MRWKQFFTPVQSVSTDQGRKLAAERPSAELTILDVRQPREYAKAHLPGAKLIPLPELVRRLDELDPDKQIMVY